MRCTGNKNLQLSHAVLRNSTTFLHSTMHNKARAVCLLVHTDLDTIEVPDSSTPVEEEGESGVREYDWLQGGPSACVELVGERVWPLALNHRYLLFQL